MEDILRNSDNAPFVRKLASIKRLGEEYNKYKRITQANFICCRVSQTELDNATRSQPKVCHSAIVINSASNENLYTVFDELLSKNFVLVNSCFFSTRCGSCNKIRK